MSTYEIGRPDAPAHPGGVGTGVGDPVATDAEDPAAASAAAGVRTDELLAELRGRHRRFSFPMTVVFLVWYMLLIVTAAYSPGFFGDKVYGNVNVGLLFAFSQFLMTFLVAFLYRQYAKSRLDPVAAEIRDEVSRSAAPRAAAIRR
ncbi:MAG TPA: DUF485 domain-containing protein [Frankiaceae bacterium]|nr:DUF485 domain-containing protein [Frankiaceae bacterium]